MSQYTYLVTDTLTGLKVAELPLSGVSYESVLNAAGQLSATLTFPTVAAEPVLGRIYKTALQPLRNILTVIRDGVAMWSGPIWVTGYSTSDRKATIAGADWWSLLRKRLIVADKNYVAQDPTNIARDLLTYTQGRGNLGIAASTDLTGQSVTIAYDNTQVLTIASVIETLATSTPFDFGLDTTIEAGALVHRLNFSYPTRGVAAANSALVFEYGRNLVDWKEQLDGTRMANFVTGVGSGSGTSVLFDTATPAVPDATLPLLEGSIAEKDVTVLGVLQNLTQAEADRAGSPVRTVGATVLADGVPTVGQYRAGDWARFIIEPNQDPWYVDGLDEKNRIIAIKVTPNDDGGPEKVDLTLVTRPTTDALIQADIERRLGALEATA